MDNYTFTVKAADYNLIEGKKYHVRTQWTDEIMVFQGIDEGCPIFLYKIFPSMMIPWGAIDILEPVEDSQ